ncbi:MAG TPA: hypothetical protein VGQ20_06920 [Acidimicrobiales bacterium]|nr:hypothetical protein [Acidimicrobiales bacterium]
MARRPRLAAAVNGASYEFIFDDVPALRDALVLAPGPRAVALRDPTRRDAVRRDLGTVHRSVDFRWTTVTIASIAGAFPVRERLAPRSTNTRRAQPTLERAQLAGTSM